MKLLIILLLPAIVSMLAVKWVFFKVLKVARMKNLVDHPDARKSHKEPVPVMGGMAVFFGLIVGMMFAITLVDCSSLRPLVLCASIMFFVGTLDDFLGLSPLSRILFEVFTIACSVIGTGLGIDNLLGLWGIYELPYWLTLSLTVFAGVGIINSINMIDGVNGLSSGLCMISSLLFACIFYTRGDYANCVMGLCMAASLWLFFLHNVFGTRSKMFIGDSGSMLMGIIVIWYVVNLLNGSKNVTYIQMHPGLNLAALALAIESVPVFDTIRVMTSRIIKGRSPFSADKGHLHHRFLQAGISHGVTAFCMIFIDVCIVVVSYFSYKLGCSLEVQLYNTVMSSIILVWGTYALLKYEASHNTGFPAYINKVSIIHHFGHKRWWLRFSKYLDEGEC